MLYLGLFPNAPLNATRIAAAALTMPAGGTELAATAR
jgi:hypothetical protein